MTDINWESTLPTNFQQSGYTEGNIDNLISTTMNNGPPKTRPRNTEAYQPIKGSMLLTTAQRNTFKAFYKDTLKWGSLSFYFPEPGVPTETVETKILSQTITPVSGNVWKLTMSLEFLLQ